MSSPGRWPDIGRGLLLQSNAEMTPNCERLFQNRRFPGKSHVTPDEALIGIALVKDLS